MKLFLYMSKIITTKCRSLLNERSMYLEVFSYIRVVDMGSILSANS